MIKRPLHTFAALMLFMLSLATFSSAWAVSGVVYFSKGPVFAVSAQGVRLELHKDMPVESGQTLLTEAGGMLQIKFADGGFLALPPKSELRLDDYRYTPEDSTLGHAFMTLLRGGLRTVSGLIGKAHPESYKVETFAGTIGIRGTHYLARVCQGDCFTADNKAEPDGLFASVVRGRIHVANAAGQLDIDAGQAAYVANRATPPAVVKHMPMVSTSANAATHHDGDNGPGERVEASVEEMEATLRNLAGLAPGVENLSGMREEGDAFLAPASGTYQAGQDVFKVDGRPVIANLTGIEGGGASDVSKTSATGSLIETEINVSAYVDGTSALRVIANASGSASNGTASVNDVYADGDLFMVRWGGPGQLGGTLDMNLSGNQSVHWLIAKPYASPLPTTGSASYNMLAATRISSTDPTLALGTLNSATVGVDFGASTACGGLACANYTLVADIFSASGYAGIDAIGDFETGNGGTQPGTVSGSACSGAGCAAYVHSVFGGSGLSRDGVVAPSKLGLLYQISDPAGGRAFHGAAALGRQ